ncbi:MAG: hypothetical protein ACREA9_11760, partial [Pyrinomonadaceae bacterium]
METIRILIYTDLADISDNIGFFGLTDVVRFIKYKWSRFINFEIDIKNRHFDYVNNRPGINGATLLTKTLLRPYHELWVFGFEQANRRTQPLNELVKDEINALRAWMQFGGVLITGDHSNPFNKNPAAMEESKDYLNLGRAVGRRIPRAGDLRKWKGPPTGFYEGDLNKRENYNTQEGTDPSRLDDIVLELDNLPQTLRLVPAGSIHRLFWWCYDPTTKKVIPISKFPDHIHEGRLIIDRLGPDWPKGSTKPKVVAQGRDKRFTHEQRYYDLVVAFDGDSMGVGRIVADSSFHHYLNINLLTMPSRDTLGNPIAGTDLDQIGQYYANLAYWLAPKRLREKLGLSLFFRAAGHPAVIEELGGSTVAVGHAALKVLTSEIGVSNLYLMLAPSALEEGTPGIFGLLGSIFLGAFDASQTGMLEPQATLGHVIRAYHAFFDEHDYTN